MGSIASSSAGLPAGTAANNTYAQAGSTGASTYGALSSSAVETMRSRGIPEHVIGVADATVGTSQTVANGGFSPSINRGVGPADQGGAAQQSVPTELDTPDPLHTGLLKSHVMLLRAAGTPEALLAWMSAQNYNAGYVEQYLQTQIMQYPEAWDAVLQQQGYNVAIGNARRGLVPLVGAQNLGPTPANGSPGQSGGFVPGAPGAPGPGTAMSNTGSSLNGVIKGVVWTLAGVALAFGAWKLFHRNPAGVEQGAQMLGMRAGEAVRAGGAARADGLLQAFASESGTTLRMNGIGAAAADAMSRGLPVVAEWPQRMANTGLVNNWSKSEVERWAMLDVFKSLGDSGQLPSVLGSQGADSALTKALGNLLRGAAQPG